MPRTWWSRGWGQGRGRGEVGRPPVPPALHSLGVRWEPRSPGHHTPHHRMFPFQKTTCSRTAPLMCYYVGTALTLGMWHPPPGPAPPAGGLLVLSKPVFAFDPRGSTASPWLPSCQVPSSFPVLSGVTEEIAVKGVQIYRESEQRPKNGVALGCSPGGPAGPPTSSTLAPSPSRSPPGLPPPTQPSPSLQIHPSVRSGVSMVAPAAWTLLQGIRAPDLP